MYMGKLCTVQQLYQKAMHVCLLSCIHAASHNQQKRRLLTDMQYST
jgi:hypothetical protein